MKSFLFNCLLIGISVFGCLFIGDRILGLLGFPEKIHPQYAHPPNFSEIRKNIEFTYKFETNSQGLRYPEISLEKKESEFRVFVVGDSYTEGTGVEANETYTRLMEQSFTSNRVAFINGGLSGTGPLEYGRLFLNVGLRYKPDALLISLFANDLPNTSIKEKPKDFYYVPLRYRYNKVAHLLFPRITSLLKKYQLQKEHTEITSTDNFIEAVEKRARKQKIEVSQVDLWKTSLPMDLVEATNRGEFHGNILSAGLLKPYYWESLDLANLEAQQKWKTMKILLTEIVKQAQQHNIEVAVLFFPAAFQYDPHHETAFRKKVPISPPIQEKWSYENTALQNQLEKWANEQKIPFFDLTPSFRNALTSGGAFNWAWDGHWNVQGHRIAAEAITNWIKQNQIFSFYRETD